MKSDLQPEDFQTPFLTFHLLEADIADLQEELEFLRSDQFERLRYKNVRIGNKFYSFEDFVDSTGFDEHRENRIKEIIQNAKHLIKTIEHFKFALN